MKAHTTRFNIELLLVVKADINININS